MKAEIRKKWERYKLTRTGSSGGSRTRSTFASTYVSRARNSLYSVHSTSDRGETIQLSSTQTDVKNSTPTKYSFTFSKTNNPTCEKCPPYTINCNGQTKASRLMKKESDNRRVGQLAKEEEIRPIMIPPRT